MRALCLLSLLLFGLPVLATEVFKTVGPDGETRFTDRPEDGAVEVRVPGVQTVDGGGPVGELATKSESEDTPFSYSEFKIVSPDQDASLRDNEGNVRIQIVLSPGLRPDDQINIYMNGNKLGSGRSTNITLTNVDRGTHSLQASVVDKSGKDVARSDTVNFTLHRAAAGG